MRLEAHNWLRLGGGKLAAEVALPLDRDPIVFVGKLVVIAPPFEVTHYVYRGLSADRVVKAMDPPIPTERVLLGVEPVAAPAQLPKSAGVCCAHGARGGGPCVCAYRTTCVFHGEICWGRH